jgi:hypothetical protein
LAATYNSLWPGTWRLHTVSYDTFKVCVTKV